MKRKWLSTALCVALLEGAAMITPVQALAEQLQAAETEAETAAETETEATAEMEAETEIAVEAETEAAPGVVYTVDNVDADYAIEADISLTGIPGSASVAKVVINGSSAAIAYDLVSDATPQGTYFYRENIHSNAAGGQDYSTIDQFVRPELETTYHLMVSFRKSDGMCGAYLNGELVDTFWNPEMTHFSTFDLAVEAAAMANDHGVDATFSNIRVKKGSKISSDDWSLRNMDNNPGVHSDTSRFKSEGIITISGSLELAEGEDWDTAYDGVSGKIYFD